MSVSNIATHKSGAPPLAASCVSWRRILLRAPILWSSGVLAMILASAILIPSTVTATIPISILVAFWVVILSIWTALSVWVFCSDLFLYALQPVVLKPALAAALQWSLDDVLQFMFNPQWIVSIAGAFLLPTTLYTLPTTPEQRAQVLRAAGFLPPCSDENTSIPAASAVLTEPGSWRYVMPMSIQRFLIIEPDNSAAPQSPEEEAGAEATDDEDDSCPYSISPVWKEHKEGVPTYKEVKQNQAEPVTNQQSSTSEIHGLEPHEIIYKIVTDLLRSKFENGLSALVSPQQIGVVAATAVAILTLQLRHSATARMLVRNLVHGSVTAGAGTALVASLTALLAPYCFPTATNRQDTPQSKFDVNFLMTSVMTTLVGAATATVIPRSPGQTFSFLRATLARIPWKGAAAVLVLALFRQRHRRRLERAAHR